MAITKPRQSRPRLPQFYRCPGCRYWHPKGQDCRPAHNGYTVAVLDAMHPDHNGDKLADWTAVRPPRRRTQ